MQTQFDYFLSFMLVTIFPFKFAINTKLCNRILPSSNDETVILFDIKKRELEKEYET